jgi:hypothetical protein
MVGPNNQFFLTIGGKMLKTNSRKVNFYEILLTTTSREVPNPNQTSMLAYLRALIPFMSKGSEISQGKIRAEITDFHWDDKNTRLFLLLNKPDPDLSDVVYKDIRTKKRRSGDKKPTEAIELSAHVVIEASKNQSIAQIKMTMGSGIYISHIVNLLNNLYKDNKTSPQLASIVNQPVPSNAKDKHGNALTHKTRHKIRYSAHPNTALREILSTGRLHGIELIESAHQNFDSNGQYEITRHSLSVSTGQAQISVDGIRRLIRTGSTRHNIQADKVKIEYEDAEGNPGSKSLNVNQLDEAFTRTETIDLETPHTQQQTILSDEITHKLILLG